MFSSKLSLSYSAREGMCINFSCLEVIIHQRRYKYKPKWAQQLKKTSDCQRALDHFDAFYKPVFRDRWPSIRLALLSLPKHCAVVNKFSDMNKTQNSLDRIGSFNILKHIRDQKPVIKSLSINYLDDVIFAKSVEPERHESSVRTERQKLKSKLLDDDGEEVISNSNSSRTEGPSELSFVVDGDNLEPYDEELYKDNVDVFVPPEPMVSEKDKRLQDEIQMSSFRPSGDLDIDIVPMEPVVLPEDLNAYVFPSGIVSRFPQSKVFNQTSGYYLMDAASLLPVMALNVTPSDHVLDLCAAPGGKSLLMLQTIDFDKGGHLHCNDSSQSRVSRLKNVLRSYIPPSVARDVTLTLRDGITFNQPAFNKVLVDVPCNTDRHVVTQEDNNVFKPSRSGDRLRLLGRQRDLLVSAVRSCVVGGSIVYSTCTLSLGQNDGVVQAAVEMLREQWKMDVAVQDLSPLAKAFDQTFTFYDRCRYGQMVLPSLTQNFGPLYLAKLQRIR